MARILVVTNLFPPHAYGGYELTCGDFVRELGGRYDISVLTTDWRIPGVSDAASEKDGRVDRTLRWYWHDHRFPKRRLRDTIALERWNRDVLTRRLREWRPDVVSVWHMGAMSMGLLDVVVASGVPLVCVVCDDWLVYGPDVDDWMRRVVRRPRLGALLERLTGLPARLADLTRTECCFVSESTRQRARASAFSLGPASVVYPGIDPVDFPVREELSDRPWRWRLLFAGRLDPRKGVETALRTLPLLPEEATLDVVGRGSDESLSRYRALAESLGITHRVTFTHAERSGMRAWYDSHDVVLFPIEWDEPFGLVPLEAMARGTAVVATAEGGAREYLADEENALLAPRRDPDAFARAVRRLAADPALRHRLAAGGRATALSYGMTAWIARLEARHLAAIAGAG